MLERVALDLPVTLVAANQFLFGATAERLAESRAIKNRTRATNVAKDVCSHISRASSTSASDKARSLALSEATVTRTLHLLG